MSRSRPFISVCTSRPETIRSSSLTASLTTLDWGQDEGATQEEDSPLSGFGAGRGSFMESMRGGGGFGGGRSLFKNIDSIFNEMQLSGGGGGGNFYSSTTTSTFMRGEGGADYDNQHVQEAREYESHSYELRRRVLVLKIHIHEWHRCLFS